MREEESPKNGIPEKVGMDSFLSASNIQEHLYNMEVIIRDICRERTFVMYHTHLWSLRKLIM